MFLGEYYHTIDAKGRLFIPAKFRDKLSEGFILSKGFDKCIRVYPMAEWEKFVEKLEELPAAKDRRILRYFFSSADEGVIDSQGRVTINQTMRSFANLEKEVVISGGCRHFEIWSLKDWEAEQKATDDALVIGELVDRGM